LVKNNDAFAVTRWHLW